MRTLLALVLLVSAAQAQLGPGGATASFKGSLPPKPTADLSAADQATIEAELAKVSKAFEAVKKHERSADAAIFIKAVRYALDFHEWYDKKPADGIKKANALLAEAQARIASLAKNETPWMNGSGQKVLGFYSNIDDSAQPYGVEVPEGLEFGPGKKPVPMWVWLHGRGDTATDLHFVYSRLTAKKPGQFQPAGTIVIHPFGRYCNGWKSAGETDVFEARDDATRRFNVDENRIALAGFSMGGAGAWHLGAHFADQWACVHTGAGFADVKRYTKLTPDQYPAWYEQKLWGVYDVPDYARNFFNVPLVCYSGENDSQRDSAEYMLEVLGKEGLHPPHLIGPGMGHKYHPEVIKDVQARIEAEVAKGRDPLPTKVVLQYRADSYSHMHWVQVAAVEKPWEDTRLEAEIKRGTAGSNSQLIVSTKNIRAFMVDRFKLEENDKSLEQWSVRIDDQSVTVKDKGEWDDTDSFEKVDGRWTAIKHGAFFHGKLTKAGGTCMDAALKQRFAIVTPEKAGSNPAVDAWVKAEMEHFIQRWRGLMRGDPIVISVEEAITMGATTSPDKVTSYRYGMETTLVLWGTPETNRLIADLIAPSTLPFRTLYGLDNDGSMPIEWTADSVAVGSAKFDAKTHVLCACYPRGDGMLYDAYDYEHDMMGSVILNSGLTFREAHDKTNSLQNPKLPDWAILDITQPPNAETAGKVVAADFFDEHWQVKPTTRKPEER